MRRVKRGGGDHLRQLLHVRRLDVDDVEALIVAFQTPQIQAQIVGGEEGLSVAVDRDAVDMISVRVAVDATRHSGHDGIERN